MEHQRNILSLIIYHIKDNILAYFKTLNYTLGDEDSSVEYALLPDNVNLVMAIAGSGSRVLPLLAKRPKNLICVDILDEQLFFTELRIEALRVLSFDDFRAFLGYPPLYMSPERRKELFKSINLSENTRAYLSKLFIKNNWSEPIYLGKFENTLKLLSKINSLVTGKAGRGIFNCVNLDEQLVYLKNNFPHLRWKLILFLLGNSSILNSLLYKGDFPKKNIPGTHFDNFYRIYNQIFNRIPVNKSFFAQLSFFGKIVSKAGNPIEVCPELFQQMKNGLHGCDVSYRNESIIELVKESTIPVDFLSLSDVPSFLKGETEQNYLQVMRPGITENGSVVVRGNLRITHPDFVGFEKIKNGIQELEDQEKTQLWKVDIYRKK